MAIVQISKIQHRTGANIDLPQLDEGEIGFSTDEQKLFIGNDPILYPVPEGESTTQLEILTEVSNLDHAKITGSANTELQITSPKIGQMLVLDGSSSTLIGNKWVNWSGNLLGNGVAHGNNKLHLGAPANIQITGGMNGGVLSTDGAGNLYWGTGGGGGGGGGVPQNFTNNEGKYLRINTGASDVEWIDVFSDSHFGPTVRSNINVAYTSGFGNLSYSNSTGVISYTGVSISDIRGQFSAGTGVSYDNANGQFSIAQDVGTESDVTFNVITVNDITDNGLYQEDDNGMALKGVVFNGTGNTLQTNTGFYYDSSHNTLTVGKLVTDGNITIGATDINGDPMVGYLGLANITSGDTTKASNDPGVAGQICWDQNYIYICTHQDTWEKIEIGATVTAGGVTSYNDLTDKPTLFSGSYTDLTNKPTLFSGSYNDLTSKPTLFSGSYTDLTNKPSLGNIVTVDLDGSTSNVLYGNGAFAALPATPNLQIVLSAGATATSSVSIGSLTLTETIQSIDTTTGALVVDGGIGVAKSVNVGGALSVAETTVIGNATLDNNIDVVSVVGNVSNLYISTDEGAGISILSKPTQSGTGLYIRDADNILSFLVGNAINGNADEMIHVQANAMVPANHSVIDLGTAVAAWKSVYAGDIYANGILKTKLYTVGTLPSASVVGAGARAIVSDCDSFAGGNFGAVVTASPPGSNVVPVYSDGQAWRIG